MNMLFELAFSLFDAVLCVYFISRFNSAALSPRKNVFLLPAVLVIFAFSIVNDLFLSGFSMLGTLIFLSLYIAYGILVSDKKYIRGILSGCIFEVVFVLLSSLLYFIMSIIIKDYDQLMQGEVGIFRYAYVIIHKIALFAVIKVILMAYKKTSTISKKHGIIAFLFSLTTVLGLGALMYVCAELETREIQLQAMIITLVLAFGNIIMYTLIYQMQKEQAAKYELKLLKEKMAFEQVRHRDVLAIWSDVRKSEHDIKHHFTVINGYLEQGELEKSRAYINELMPSICRSNKLLSTQNSILDYLINSRLGALKDTRIVISGSVGDLSDISDVDLACLIGNILDNATEALEKVKRGKEKRLELLFLRQNSNRIIICKNTVSGSVLEKNGELQTTKDDRDAHGYGTKIIQRVVEKYHGMVDYFEEFDMFGVQIILPSE